MRDVGGLRNRFLVLLATVALAALLAGAAFAQEPPAPEGKIQTIQGAEAVASELIVGYEEGATSGQREAARAKVDGRVEDAWRELDAELLRVLGEAAATIRAVENLPGVRYADPNQVFEPSWSPNDPIFRQQPISSGQWNLRKISAVGAWDVARGRGAKVVIIDTGVRRTHDDLDAAGKITRVINTVPEPNTGDVSDTKAHGTRMAGIIAAETHNGIGVAGVAPLAQLHICKASIQDGPDGRSQYPVAAVIDCIQWADNVVGSDVASMSFASLTFDQTLQDAINAAHNRPDGMNFVAAAGNDNSKTDTVYPAAFDNVIGVGATGNGGINDQRWQHPNGIDGQNCGPFVDVTAPAWNIPAPTNTGDNRYSRGQATSQSTSTAAGVVALLRGQGKTVAKAEEDLQATATDLTGAVDPDYAAGRDDCSGLGLVNASKAVLRPGLTTP